MIAYVDGSYNKVTKICGSGVVLFCCKKAKPEFITHSFFDFDGDRNVGGEMQAAYIAAREAYGRDPKKTIDLYFDYYGIEKWVTGEWQAKKGSTKNYHTRMRRMIKNGLIIHFHKVKAHSGDRWNNVADALAKQSCNLD